MQIDARVGRAQARSMHESEAKRKKEWWLRLTWSKTPFGWLTSDIPSETAVGGHCGSARRRALTVCVCLPRLWQEHEVWRRISVFNYLYLFMARAHEDVLVCVLALLCYCWQSFPPLPMAEVQLGSVSFIFLQTADSFKIFTWTQHS